MKRTVAESLLLVNWKGVPYRRYELDRGVTALEGANGAGKTTVMIAAYVVLMPDIAKLRFANLGESDRTGGDRGIFGRLGIGDRPSYAALDLRLSSGQRLVAGVHLERGAEPEVRLEPFLLHALSDDVTLQSLFLDRVGTQDAVPLFSRLKELVTLAGGRFEGFPVKRDYFTSLFDHGVTPLRLGLEDERTKFNEMLRTSMVGGISQMLGSGLRSFLFREESGLAETLKRMKQNLDECRRSRLEVRDSQRIEQELRGLYEPGRKVFAAALLATRQYALDQRGALDDARRQHESAVARLQAKEREHAEAKASIEALDQRVQRLEREQQDARSLLERVTKARDLAVRREQLFRDEIELRAARDRARATLLEAVEHLARARQDEKTAAENRDRVAEGLAQTQKGVAEFDRRAGLYRVASSALNKAGELLEEPVHPDALAALMTEVNSRIDALDTRRSTLDQRKQLARRKRSAFVEVHEALTSLVEERVPYEAAFEAAVGRLRAARDWADLSARRPALVQERTRVADTAEKQRAAWDAARRLSTPDAPLQTAASVVSAHAAVREDLEVSRQRLESAKQRIEAHEREAIEAEKLAVRLEPARDRWTAARELGARLGEKHGASLVDVASVEALHFQLSLRRDESIRTRDDLKRRSDEIAGRLRALEQVTPGRDAAMETLAQRVGGEWLVERFDDVELEDAGRLEAQLGPLRDALVVDSPEAAARTLATEPSLRGTLWLVDAETTASLRRLPDGAEHAHVVVKGQQGWRVTSIPESPRLGRRARMRRIEELRDEEKAVGDRIVGLLGELRSVEHAIERVAGLRKLSDELDRPDPQLEIASLRARATTLRTQATTLRAEWPVLEATLR